VSLPPPLGALVPAGSWPPAAVLGPIVDGTVNELAPGADVAGVKKEPNTPVPKGVPAASIDGAVNKLASGADVAGVKKEPNTPVPKGVPAASIDGAVNKLAPGADVAGVKEPNTLEKSGVALFPWLPPTRLH